MVKRDAGPSGGWCGDTVDGRRNAGVLVLPVAVLLVVASILSIPVVQAVVTTLWLAVLLAVPHGRRLPHRDDPPPDQGGAPRGGRSAGTSRTAAALDGVPALADAAAARLAVAPAAAST
jgi:hypothetical protein